MHFGQFGGNLLDLSGEGNSEGGFSGFNSVLVFADFLPVLALLELSDSVVLEGFDVSGGASDDVLVIDDLGVVLREESGDGSDLFDLLLSLGLDVSDGLLAGGFLILSELLNVGLELVEDSEDLGEDLLVGEALALGELEEGGDEGGHGVVGVLEHGLEFVDLVAEGFNLNEGLAVLGEQFVGDDVLEGLDDHQFLLGFNAVDSVLLVGSVDAFLEGLELLLGGGELSAVGDLAIGEHFIVGVGSVGSGLGGEDVGLDFLDVGFLESGAGTASGDQVVDELIEFLVGFIGGGAHLGDQKANLVFVLSGGFIHLDELVHNSVIGHSFRTRT